jgi:hypothetical protein
VPEDAESPRDEAEEKQKLEDSSEEEVSIHGL